MQISLILYVTELVAVWNPSCGNTISLALEKSMRFSVLKQKQTKTLTGLFFSVEPSVTFISHQRIWQGFPTYLPDEDFALYLKCFFHNSFPWTLCRPVLPWSLRPTTLPVLQTPLPCFLLISVLRCLFVLLGWAHLIQVISSKKYMKSWKASRVMEPKKQDWAAMILDQTNSLENLLPHQL